MGSIAEMVRKSEAQVFDCPSCGKRSKFRIGIKVAGVVGFEQYMAERGPIEEGAADFEDYYRSNTVACACCGVAVQVHFELKILGASLVDGVPDKPAAQRVKQDPEQVNAARQRAARQYHAETLAESGLLSPFEEALRVVKSDDYPKEPAAMLLSFLEKCARITVPSFILSAYVREFGSARLAFYSAEGVVGVVADSRIRAFIPIYYVRGRATELLNGGAPPARGKVSATRFGDAGAPKLTKLRTPAPQARAEEWIRTRNGYVAGRGLLFDELKGRTAGNFAKATGNY